MSAIKTGSSLRSLVLTPERIPSFIIPPHSPLLFLSPRPHRMSPDRTRLLSEPDEASPGTSPPGTPISPATSRRFLPRLRRPRRAAAEPDTDVTTRAAMSLPHVGKVTTPYGFRAVLAASPCTRRRESLFHQNKPVTETHLRDPADPLPPPGPGPSESRVSLRPVRALGLQLMKELKKPAAALKALSPAPRTRPR
ncbi:C2 calcium-dependent domain-containing protein 4A-like [Micropterus salmoides]|uniref:C2 calcium-dependent domain-containing protein 4A-like n=1 Tax=Micropterus salmoides TaxID=27706 RepID=UPI0018EC7490|nr:C2 calcium-dependent domain-containing protein 4A-like [Micropterus salmoides]